METNHTANVPAQVLARVRKLLALANSANPNEAANAAAQAQRLMDEYRLSTGDVSVGVDDPMTSAFIDDAGRKRAPVWRMRLFANVAKANACFPVRVGSRMRLVGRASDVEFACYLFTHLSNEVDRLAAREARGQGRTWANEWRNGCVTTLRERLAADRAATTSGQTAGALVLRRGSAARDWYTANIGRVQAGRTLTLKATTSGFAAGQEAGHRVEIRKGITTPTTRRIGNCH